MCAERYLIRNKNMKRWVNGSEIIENLKIGKSGDKHYKKNSIVIGWGINL